MKQDGFSFVELIVVFGIVATFTGLVLLNLMGSERRSSLAGMEQQVLADIAHSRLQSLSGFNASPLSGGAHGVYFDQNSYTLFTGATYNSANETNTVFTLPENIIFTDITLVGSTVIFATGSGEIVGYSGVSNQVAVAEQNSGLKKTIQFNVLGTVISHE